MIHVDINKDLVEFEGSGADMISEMALLIATSLSDFKEEHNAETVDLRETAKMIVTSIYDGVCYALDALENEEEGDTEHEATGDIQEERSGAHVSTEIKAFRNYRKERRITS